MENASKKIIVAITGASGSIYAKRILEILSKLKFSKESVGVVFSKTAQKVWQYELNESHTQYPFTYYESDNFFSSIASGSSKFDAMIVIPCSMGTLGKIANGIADDLIARAAEVTLKQKRKLILVTRETPLSLISIKNMEKITLGGGIICPANPSFYRKPENIEQVVDSVVERVLDLAGIQNDDTYRWGE